ncbi:hypothetical protein DFH09DRAFT_1315010 [Mycena vulgaris]|nr:hypothetical protein DFH09DRAFT_1315010 [Mycena vulgaris]
MASAPPGAPPTDHEVAEDEDDEVQETIEWFDVDDNGSVKRPSTTLVRPCGVIFARATFFGAEAVSNVLLFVKNAFSVPGAYKPDHFIYDTNCDAKQQVMKEPRDRWWDSVGMCVDVWHFLNKHKVSHEFRQKYCNPADYPELMNEDGKTWFFNTSIAEQVNVWLGGYHAIVREMLPVKYNFFLDEMIRLRNIATVTQLELDGHHPRHAPAPEPSAP